MESKDEVSILFSTMDFSICYNHQTGSGVHPASYPIRTWGSMPDGGSVVTKAKKLTFHFHLVTSLIMWL